ncbi:MAG: class I SAM-dependent methyltransferase [Nitrospira sp.]|nr:class I SAM-dependent methyltransferase [Nitrospira sp.]
MNRHLRSLRLTEIDRALKLASPWLTEHASILEIGAGCGHQAAELHRRGFRVTAIDVTPCKPPDPSEFSVELYDGKHIPLTDHSVDIIFSSNTLEHIAEISEFLIELRKVLAEGGIAIHIVPSATWRFWTTLAHFPYLLFSLIRTVLPDTSKPVRTASAQNHRGVRLFRALFPHHHGEHGNLITEHFSFRRQTWEALFNKTGWTILQYDHNHLFYTGYSLLEEYMPIDLRSRIAALIGGSCHIFILKP